MKNNPWNLLASKKPMIFHFPLMRPCLVWILALVLGVNGCGADSDKVVVDFTKTVPVARPGERASPTPPLRVAVAAMISPKETFDLYRQLLAYLGHRLNRDLEFVQRKTYGEIDELLRRGEIDLAFICSGPYVAGKERFGFESLAVPEVHGSHFYRSYLIVNKDSPYHHLEELKGHTRLQYRQAGAHLLAGPNAGTAGNLLQPHCLYL